MGALLAFLALCVFGLVAFVILGTVAAAVLQALVWIVTFPFRLLFKILLGLGGIVVGLILAPVIALMALIALVVSLVVAVVSLLAPLLPMVLLGAFAWTIFRLASRKQPTPPPPPAGFWS